VQNVSEEPIRSAAFYGEYYDAAGRLCFSLVFSLDKNETKVKRPLVPGAVRRLYAVAPALLPASEPVELRLSLLDQTAPTLGQSTSVAVVQAPITFSLRSPLGSDRLTLPIELTRTDGPIIDLVLAKVTVDGSGRVGNIDVLHAVTEEVGSWSLKFLANQAFYPTTSDWISETDSTLVLLRAVTAADSHNESHSVLVGNSPWVAKYVSTVSTESVPLVTEILFRRPATKVKQGGRRDWTLVPPAPPGVFETYTAGSDWCPGIVRMVPDPSSSLHFRRELISSGKM